MDLRVFSGCEKSLRLHIKGGVRARVKGDTTFEARAVFGIFFVSSSVNCIPDLNVRLFRISVLVCPGSPPNFRTPPNIGTHRVSAKR
jgi:hypothetical protein